MTDLPGYGDRKKKIYVELGVQKVMPLKHDDIIVRLRYDSYEDKYFFAASSKENFDIKYEERRAPFQENNITTIYGNLCKFKTIEDGHICAFEPFKEGLDNLLGSLVKEDRVIDYDTGIRQAQKLICSFEEVYKYISPFAENYDAFMEKEFGIDIIKLLKPAQLLDEDSRTQLLQVGCHVIQGLGVGFDAMRKGLDRQLWEENVTSKQS